MMTFEEALSALRKGAKISHSTFDDDEYLIGCYFSLPSEDFEEFNKIRNISICRMKGNEPHPDMRSRLSLREHMDLVDQYPFLHEKMVYPTINLLLITSDDWKII